MMFCWFSDPIAGLNYLQRAEALLVADKRAAPPMPPFADVMGNWEPDENDCDGALVVTEDGDAGFFVWRVADAPDFSEFYKLYVTPAARGKGLGARIADEVIRRARARGVRELGVEILPESLDFWGAYLQSRNYLGCPDPFFESDKPHDHTQCGWCWKMPGEKIALLLQ